MPVLLFEFISSALSKSLEWGSELVEGQSRLSRRDSRRFFKHQSCIIQYAYPTGSARCSYGVDK